MWCQFATSILAAVLLTGCVTNARIAEYRAELDTTCRGYGFKPDTDEYRQCLMQTHNARVANPFCTVVRGVPVGC